MKKLSLLLTIGLFSLANVAQAAFISTMTGHTAFDDGNGNTGYVSFAVYRNTGGNWMSTLGISADPSVNITPAQIATGLERNVFFYQITVVDGLVDSFQISPNDAWTAGGALNNNNVFNENGTNITGADKLFLGPNPDLSANNPPETDQVDVNSLGFDSQPGAIGVSDVNFTSGAFQFSSLIGGKQESVVFFLTSNSDPLSPQNYPDTFNAPLVNGVLTGSVPVSTPEPGSILLISAGMGCGFIGWRRKRKQASEEIVTEEEQPVA